MASASSRWTSCIQTGVKRSTLARPAASWSDHQRHEQPCDPGGAVGRRPAPAGHEDDPKTEGGGCDRVDGPQPGEEVLRAGQVPDGETDGVLGEEGVGEGGHRSRGADQYGSRGYHHRPHRKAAVGAGTDRASAGRPEGGEGQSRQEQQRVDQMERDRDRTCHRVVAPHQGGEHQPGPDERLADDGDHR